MMLDFGFPHHFLSRPKGEVMCLDGWSSREAGSVRQLSSGLTKKKKASDAVGLKYRS